MTLLWIGIVIATFVITVVTLVLLRQIPETMLRMFGMSAFAVGLVLTIIFTVKHPMNLAVILLHMTVFVLVAIVADGILTARERRKRVAAGLPAYGDVEESPVYVATEESSAYRAAGLPGWTPVTRGRVCRIAAAFVGCALYLAAGLFSANHIVRTEITVTTDKNIPVGQNGTSYCIVQLSDVHLGTTVDLKDWERLLARVANEKPDMVVITGDFTDSSTSREDMVRACEAFDRLPRECAIYYVPGNHDSEEGKFTPGELQENLQKHSVRTLQDEFACPALNISVLGRKDRSVSRSSMGEFWKEYEGSFGLGAIFYGADIDVTEDSDSGNNENNENNVLDAKTRFNILLDHQPNDFDAEAREGVDLVLCGHTHGGFLMPLQLIAPWMPGLLGEADLLSGTEKRGGTTFVVSSGVGTWATDFKTGTKSEYVVIYVKRAGE